MGGGKTTGCRGMGRELWCLGLGREVREWNLALFGGSEGEVESRVNRDRYKRKCRRMWKRGKAEVKK